MYNTSGSQINFDERLSERDSRQQHHATENNQPVKIFTLHRAVNNCVKKKARDEIATGPSLYFKTIRRS
jgi:hypothetical protein